VQSLPIGCKFSIISFGSRFELHTNFSGSISETGIWDYSDLIIDQALEAIENFYSDFGGTDLL